MSKAGSFASLQPRLLASKGAARPAMRVGNTDDFEAMAAAQAELGWNDFSADDAAPVATLRPARKSHDQSTRRAAFTLRLDATRHLKLRLASTLQNTSAQMLVTEALDRFLEKIPQLDSLASQASQSAPKA